MLALYATGRSTGLAIDCGDGACHTSPIYESSALQHGAPRLEVAGRDLTGTLILVFIHL